MQTLIFKHVWTSKWSVVHIIEGCRSVEELKTPNSTIKGKNYFSRKVKLSTCLDSIKLHDMEPSFTTGQRKGSTQPSSSEWPQAQFSGTKCMHSTWQEQFKRLIIALGVVAASGGGAPRNLLGWWRCSIPCLGCGLDTGSHLSFVKTPGPAHVRSVYFTVCKFHFDF